MTLTTLGKQIIRCYRSAARAIESAAQSKLHLIAAKAVSNGTRSAGPPRKKLARRIAAIVRS